MVSKSMQFVIVGAGAMGSLFGGLLGQVTPVYLYDVWKEHVDAINNNGLLMTRGNEKKYIPVKATSDPYAVEKADVVIVFVKYHQTRNAIRNALPFLNPHTLVCTFQNGIGNVDIIKEVVIESNICYGLTTLTSDLQGPGHIEMTFHGQGETYLWPLSGIVDERVKETVKIMNEAGINTEITPRVEYHIWRKLMINASMNTLCSITRLPVGYLLDTPQALELIKSIVYEIGEIAQAKGIPLTGEEGFKHLQEVGIAAKDHVPSMVIDVRNKKKTEIECLNGAIVEEGKRLGVNVPFNTAITDIIRTIEQNYAGQIF